MQCYGDLVNCLSGGILLIGLWHLVHHKKAQTTYGRYIELSPSSRLVPARLAWFLQEIPAFLVPLLLMLSSDKSCTTGKHLLLGTFGMHYFHR